MIATCSLGDVVDVSAGQPAPKPSEFGGEGSPFIRAGSLQNLLNGGTLADCERISDAIATAKRLRLYPTGTIVFAKSGMSATLGRVYRLAAPAYVVSHLAALVPTGKYDPVYLTYWLRRHPPSHLIKDPAYPSIRVGEIEELRVPDVPLLEQQRVAAILDKAEAIQRNREQILSVAGQFVRSIFLQMFGDPVRNPRLLRQKQLSECATFISGATPSKGNSAYWTGDFPWVSPKDMKVDLIFDAEDHVSELAFAETNLKRVPSNTPLLVVRGMILAHTAPIALTMREVAINQDMKAVCFQKDIDPVFGFWCLKVLQGKILDKVDTAAHGTKRIDMARLGEIPIHIPSDNLQSEFTAIVKKFHEMNPKLAASLQDACNMFSTLSQRAFRGEL